MQRAMGIKGISCSLGNRTRNHNMEKCDESLGKTLVEKMTICGERGECPLPEVLKQKQDTHFRHLSRRSITVRFLFTS